MIQNYKNIKSLFSKETYKLYIMLLLNLISTVLEVFSIGLIPVFVVIITDLDLLLSKISGIEILDFVSNLSHSKIVTISALSLITIFIIKNLFLLFVLFFQGKLIMKLRSQTSNKLFSRYIFMSYEKLINKNPAILIRTIENDIGNAFTYIQAFLMLIREILILVSLLLLLFFTNYLISTVSILSLGFPVIIFYYFYRSKLKIKGKQLQIYLGNKLKTINQALGSFKELKIMNRENFFKKNFEKINLRSEQLNFFSYMVTSTPRLFLEVTALLSVALVSVILFIVENNPDSIVPLISLLAVTAIRLIPSLNIITSSLTTLRFKKPSFELISEELHDFKNTPKDNQILVSNKKISQRKINFENELFLQNLYFNYLNTDKNVLKNIDLKIQKGSKVGIIGRSGAGKSTLVDLILGLLKPNKGKIFIDNIKLDEVAESWQKKIGYIPQDIYLLDDSIRNNISFGIDEDQVNENLINKAIKMAQLEKLILSLPEKENTIVGNRGVKLSGGEKQRISIARAIYNNPEILILDEATSALDIENENKILAEMSENLSEKTSIIISHRNNTVKGCDIIYVIENGMIIDNGNFDEVMKRNSFLKETNLN